MTNLFGNPRYNGSHTFGQANHPDAEPTKGWMKDADVDRRTGDLSFPYSAKTGSGPNRDTDLAEQDPEHLEPSGHRDGISPGTGDDSGYDLALRPGLYGRGDSPDPAPVATLHDRSHPRCSHIGGGTGGVDRGDGDLVPGHAKGVSPDGKGTPQFRPFRGIDHQRRGPPPSPLSGGLDLVHRDVGGSGCPPLLHPDFYLRPVIATVHPAKEEVLPPS